MVLYCPLFFSFVPAISQYCCASADWLLFSDGVFWVLPTVDFSYKVGSFFRSHCMDYAWVTKDMSAFQSRIYSMFALSVDDRFHALYRPVRLNGSLSAPVLFHFFFESDSRFFHIPLIFLAPNGLEEANPFLAQLFFFVTALRPVGRFHVPLPWCAFPSSLSSGIACLLLRCNYATLLLDVNLYKCYSCN